MKAEHGPWANWAKSLLIIFICFSRDLKIENLLLDKNLNIKLIGKKLKTKRFAKYFYVDSTL